MIYSKESIIDLDAWGNDAVVYLITLISYIVKSVNKPLSNSIVYPEVSFISIEGMHRISQYLNESKDILRYPKQ